MKLSSANLELSRTHPQQTKLYLHVFQPRTIVQCQINNASAARGDRTIPYDTVSVGSFSAVEEGMTMLIGTTPGARDVGKIRVRSATSAQFIVSENSNIEWADNLYITILRFIEIWPVFPRIIQDPANIENVIFYKDYDLPYTNQNTILGTLICAGPHRPVLLDSGNGQVYYSASGTYNLVGSALSYDWAFEGGTPTGSVAETPGYVSYGTPGDYVTRLTISGANGAVDKTYRYISVRNRPGEGSSSTVQRWEVKDLTGSRGEGGYNVGVTIYDTMTINEGDLVMISSDDWYGSTKISIGGNAENSSSTFFVGYVSKGTVRYDYKIGKVEFQVESVTGIMKNTESFSVSVESKAVPGTWYELLDMDSRRAIYHYLKWHSTILLNTDVQFLGTDQKIQYFDSDRTSLYDSIDTYMRGAMVGEVVSDRQGKIWAEVQAEATPNATGTYLPIMELTKRDWKEQLVINDAVANKVSYLEYDGIAYSGTSTGTFAALIACAPGNAPGFRGKAERLSHLAISSQVHLNQMVGNLLANKNSKYALQAALPSNYRQIDIAPQEVLQLNVAPSDTPRNITLSSLVLPKSLTWEFDADHQVHTLRIEELPQLVCGPAGETITIPAVPDAGGYNSNLGNFNYRPGAFPSFLTSTIGNRPIFKAATPGSPSQPFVYSNTLFNYGNAFINNGTSIVAPFSGVYLIQTVVLFTPGATTIANNNVLVNGVIQDYFSMPVVSSASLLTTECLTFLYLNAGDAVSGSLSGSSLTVSSARITIAPMTGF